jgi:hypothetical protein
MQPASDGIWDGVSVIQGVRNHDPQTGTWTTPDAYPGEIHDPMSQKSYMWNRNNPILYSDPSGFIPDEEKEGVAPIDPSSKMGKMLEAKGIQNYRTSLINVIRQAMKVPANAPKISEANAGHMFRNAPGHVPDSALNRALLQRTAANQKNLVSHETLRQGGTLDTYKEKLASGAEVWVEVRNGTEITNGGINPTPRGPAPVTL